MYRASLAVSQCLSFEKKLIFARMAQTKLKLKCRHMKTTLKANRNVTC